MILEANWTLVMSATVLVLLMVAFLVSVWLAHQHSLLSVMDVENDNKDAIEHFLRVLGRAERELLVHDDGDDKTHGSLYDDEDTVKAVRERLQKCPSLRIRCLLNFNTGVKMAGLTKEFDDRFQVRYLGQRPENDVHFKIADGGQIAYLSSHEQRATRRMGQAIEDLGCREFVRKRRLGGLIDDFNRGFDKAHLA